MNAKRPFNSRGLTSFIVLLSLVVVVLSGVMLFIWDRSSSRVPYAHAEESTVAEFAANMGLSLESVTQRLHEKGFAFDDPETTIGELATKRSKTPDQLLSEMAPNVTGGAFGAGRGVGRMTFGELCAEAGVNAETARAILLEHGIEVLEDERMRDISERVDITPVDLLSLIIEDGKAAPTTAEEALLDTPSHAVEGAGNLLPETDGPANGDRFQGEGRGYGQGRGDGQGQGRGYGGGRGFGQGQGRGRAEGTNLPR